MTQNDLHFVEVRATGLEETPALPEPEVINYAIVHWRDGQIMSSEQHFFQPKGWVEPNAAAAHGYTRELWASRRVLDFTHRDAAHLNRQLHYAILAGSNIDFAKHRLNYASRCAMAGYVPWSSRSINLSSFGGLLKVAGKIENARLDALYQYLEVPLAESPDALADCMRSVAVFEALLRRLGPLL